MLKTFNEVRNEVLDLSGIDNPYGYLYDNSNRIGVYYPVKKINTDSKNFKKGNVYSYEDISGYSSIVNLDLEEVGSKNYSSGHNFIKLVERSTDKVISFVLNENYEFECIYNDFE